jgi:hypothetical protein
VNHTRVAAAMAMVTQALRTPVPDEDGTVATLTRAEQHAVARLTVGMFDLEEHALRDARLAPPADMGPMGQLQ